MPFRRFASAALLAAAACGIVPIPAHAAEPAPAEAAILATVDGRAVGVVDGDSLAVDGLEWRLMGFDAPEIDRAKCESERRLALIAKRRLEQLITDAVARRLPVALVDSGQRDRYRRPLGSLEIDGRNVRDTLIDELLVRPYNGGYRKGWCSRDSRDDLVPGPLPSRDQPRRPDAGH
jgi:endonuclease YncB( thermonuclease family)